MTLVNSKAQKSKYMERYIQRDRIIRSVQRYWY